MLNVLTDTFKANNITEYKKRRLVIWLCVVCVLQISFLVFLVPPYVYLLFKEKGLVAEQPPATSSTHGNLARDSATVIQSTTASLSVLANHLATGNVTVAIARVVSLKGSDVSLQEISTVTETATTAQMIVHGVALTREALLNFTQRLQTDKAFSQVVLPVSDFAKDSNIGFSLSMNVNVQAL
jgi:hypothetical protein